MDEQYLSDLRKCIRELDVYVEELHAARAKHTGPEELHAIEDLITAMEHRRAYYQRIFRALNYLEKLIWRWIPIEPKRVMANRSLS
jgi:hypothetical protein